MVNGPCTMGNKHPLRCRDKLIAWSSHRRDDTKAARPLLSIGGVAQPANRPPAGKYDVQGIGEIW